MAMKIPTGKSTAAAIALASSIAVSHEGLKFTPYYDPPGVLTVCRGHTGPDVIPGKRYSLAECDAFLDADMKAAISAVDRCVPGLPVEVLAAFGDAAYNIGPKIACDTKNSTAARLLKAGAIEGACKQLLRWDKARVAGQMVALPGLTRRANERVKLCLSGVEKSQ